MAWTTKPVSRISITNAATGTVSYEGMNVSASAPHYEITPENVRSTLNVFQVNITGSFLPVGTLTRTIKQEG